MAAPSLGVSPGPTNGPALALGARAVAYNGDPAPVLAEVPMPFRTRYTGLIARYRNRIPIREGARLISLGEGNTPLIQLENLPRRVAVEAEIHVKFEGLNPTGSFKDRGMTVAVTQAVDEGATGVICASTGNTSASAAAYAARAGIRAFVLIPEGKIALGKLAQAMVEGAITLQIRGNFDDGMRIVKEVAGEARIAIVNSINPFRIEGQKTAAFEVLEELGRAPDYHCIPVGNAGNITAYWKGYSEYQQEGIVAHRPCMCGYQAAGAAPFVQGAMVDHPETVATAIRIGHPQSWEQAWAVKKESGGWFDAISDEEILATQRLLATTEGIFCEPASAASLAGALRDLKAGRIEAGATIVCTLTGHGLKDPDIAMRHSGDVIPVDATLEAVRRIILDRIG